MSEYKRLKTYRLANWLCFVAGVVVVFLSTHSILAVLGAWVASWHFTEEAK